MGRTWATVAFEGSHHGPVLIEVRYPGGIFSSDWHLCRTEEEFDGLLDQIDPNAVMHASRVWDLSNHHGAVCLRR